MPRASEPSHPVRRLLPALAGLVLTVAGGASHGLLTGRWSKSRAIEDGVASLGRVPAVIGDWEGRDMSLDRRAIEVAEIDGYLMRRYRDRRGGGSVDVLVVCGRPGPISVHTPEVCYGGAGYDVESPPAGVQLGADRAWAVDMAKPGPFTPDRLHILYCWGSGGAWEATDVPRMRFTGSPALYKVYILVAPATADGPRDDVGERFARQFLPELRACLRSATAPPATPPRA